MIYRTLLKMWRRRRLARDLETELAFHKEMAAAANNPIPFGNAAVIKEHAFDLWRFNAAENLWRDMVYSLRTLRQSPGFVLTALLSLGLGIGVNTAMFSLAVEFLLSDPSVRDAKTVVYVRQGGNSHVLPATLDDLRRSGLFAGVAGENDEGFINFDNGLATQRAFATQATKNFFSVLDVPVRLGRGWTENDPDEVAVLSAHFWRTRLAGDPAILGKAIRLDGRAYTVLGVLPENYRSLVGYGFSPDILVPTYIEGSILRAYARLKPGMTVGQLNAGLPALTQRLLGEFPDRYEANQRLNAAPVSVMQQLTTERDAMTIGLFFVILLLVAGLILLVACTNVAGLLLARASVRRQEIATRLALGASRMRLLQQLLMESLLVSLAGAALGFVLALGAAKAMAAVSLPLPFPVRLHLETNWRIVSYAALLAVFSALSSGLMPALVSLKESLSKGMRRERKLRMRRVLVAAQIAVSFVVLTTAALFLQNLLRTNSMSAGFDVNHTIHAEAFLPPHAYPDGKTINPYIDRALDGLRAIPGIEAVAASATNPFNDARRYGVTLAFDGTGAKQKAQFNWNAVTPGFFHAMQIPLLRGRAFVARDNGGSKVVIVNDEFVRRYLGGREPLGAAFSWTTDKTLYRIVGVVKGTKCMTMGEDPRPQLYEPISQVNLNTPRIQFVARPMTPPVAQLKSVQETLRRAEPAAGLEVQTMFSSIGFAFLPSQVGAVLMGSMGALGLLLVVMGLYGLLAYSVARRKREIGIRMAIGASSWHVSAMVVKEFGRMMLAGLAIGLAISLLVTRPLSLFLVPGLSASDPASFVAAMLVLGLTAALALAGPLRRALKVAPMECLRCE
jgi:predicted permease